MIPTNFGFMDIYSFVFACFFPLINVSIVGFPVVDMTESLKLSFVYLVLLQYLVFPMYYGQDCYTYCNVLFSSVFSFVSRLVSYFR